MSFLRSRLTPGSRPQQAARLLLASSYYSLLACSKCCGRGERRRQGGRGRPQRTSRASLGPPPTLQRVTLGGGNAHGQEPSPARYLIMDHTARGDAGNPLLFGSAGDEEGQPPQAPRWARGCFPSSRRGGAGGKEAWVPPGCGGLRWRITPLLLIVHKELRGN